MCSVTAGISGHSYEKWQKVSGLVDELCRKLGESMNSASTTEEKYMLSFNAMLSLVTIHPWSDGNGRTTRLLMNYIQFYLGLVPTRIHNGDKKKFITTLKEAQLRDNPEPFRRFMITQQSKTLRNEIKKVNKDNDISFNSIFL